MLSSTGAPRSLASKLVSPLPLPGGDECDDGERDDECADHGDYNDHDGDDDDNDEIHKWI